MELAPSVVRKIILEEHAQLRTKLAALKDLLTRGEALALRNGFQELAHFFLKHIDQEEKILRPVLKDIDAWGSVRVARMNEEHTLQRKEVDELLHLVSSGKPSEYQRKIEDFTAELYKDMATEEREVLSPDLLKDDPIISGFSG